MAFIKLHNHHLRLTSLLKKSWAVLLLTIIIYIFLIHSYFQNDLSSLESFPISNEAITAASAYHTLQPSRCLLKTEILILFGSHPNHSDVRDVFRNSWVSIPKIHQKLKFVFGFGKLLDTERQELLVEEHRRHGDILQGHFTDSYHNVTVRDLMTFQWAIDNCPNVKYIVRADDDIVVDIYSLIGYLKNVLSKDFVGCFFIVRDPVVQRWGRYAMSLEDYLLKYYDDYCQGWLYVATPSVVQKWLRAVSETKAIWINDVYITGMLSRVANISLQILPLRYTDYYEDMVGLSKERAITHDDDTYLQLGPTKAEAKLTQIIHKLYTDRYKLFL